MFAKAEQWMKKGKSLIMQGNQPTRIFWSVLFALMLIKYGYYGVRYFPVVDDYMYRILGRHSPLDAFLNYKTYTNRPSSAVVDSFFISRFSDAMWIPLLVITVLHFATCYLLWKILKENQIKMGIIAILFFALSPFSTEATYWIIASSRIVFGMFFTALSLYFAMTYIRRREEGLKNSLVFLFFFQAIHLVSLGFYEQITVLSFACAMILFLANFRRLKSKLVVLLPVFNLAVFLGYYKYFSSMGDASVRGQLVQRNLLEHLWKVAVAYFKPLIVKQAEMYHNGTLRGFELIKNDGAWLWLVVVVAMSLVLVFFVPREEDNGKGGLQWKKLILGWMLVIIPMGPFFILHSIWICFRNVFISMLGFGLVVEWLVNLCLRKGRAGYVKMAAAAMLSVLFILSNFSEITDYRNVSFLDQEILKNYADAIKERTDFDVEKGESVLFNAKPRYVDVTCAHFNNCTASDWSFTGSLRAYFPGVQQGYVTPVKDGGYLTMETDRLKKSVYLGINDQREVFSLKGEWQGDDNLTLYRLDGTVYGTVKKVWGVYRFTLNASEESF